MKKLASEEKLQWMEAPARVVATALCETLYLVNAVLFDSSPS
jgi:hypothetical protein